MERNGIHSLTWQTTVQLDLCGLQAARMLDNECTEGSCPKGGPSRLVEKEREERANTQKNVTECADIRNEEGSVDMIQLAQYFPAPTQSRPSRVIFILFQKSIIMVRPQIVALFPS